MGVLCGKGSAGDQHRIVLDGGSAASTVTATYMKPENPFREREAGPMAMRPHLSLAQVVCYAAHMAGAKRKEAAGHVKRTWLQLSIPQGVTDDCSGY